MKLTIYKTKYVALMNIGESYAELNHQTLGYFNQSLKGFREIRDKRNGTFCFESYWKILL